MRKFVIIIYFLLSVTQTGHSQITDERIKLGLNYIYHLKNDSATIVFDDFIRSEPANPVGYFGKMLLEWWKINIDLTNESNDENFYSAVEKVVNVCDEILDNNEFNQNALLFKGGALGFRGLLKAVRESYLKAAEDGKNALNLFNNILEANPDNKDALFGVGAYNYYAEKVPQDKPILKPLTILFPKGDKIKGLLQLKEASEKSKYSKVEAKNLLVRIYINEEKNYQEAENVSIALNKEFPENPAFEKNLGKSYTLLLKYTQALEVWSAFFNKFISNTPGYTSLYLKREGAYYISLCLQRLGRLPEAEQYLLQADEISKQLDREETKIGVYINLMLAWFYDQKGEEEKADFYYDKVISMKEFDNSSTTAENYKKSRYY